jgi:hypothetical protein
MVTDSKPAPRSWRSYLRFGLRGLIVLVLVIAIGLGRIVRNAHLQRDAVAAVRNANGQAFYDINPRNQVFDWHGPSAWRTLIARHIGIDFVSHVILVRIDVTPETDHAKCEQALVRLGAFSRLGSLGLSGVAVTDCDLARLDGLKHLELLSLENTGVSDAGLRHLRGLSNLRALLLSGTKVTDSGLADLKGLTSLTRVDLRRTNVTATGIAQIQQALPTLIIYR